MGKSIIYSEKAPAPIGPYSQAVKAANTLYVSGQIPIDTKTGQIVTDDIAMETNQVMKNISSILNAAGMDLSNIVKCSIFVTDMSDFSLVNAAYEKYFDSEPPARETVEVAALPKGVHVEISCIAVDL
ncbi:MAG: RidA family protein [Cyclobacteriaceae bacterium]|nr:RidA family protein [Cyclobacteriaceae bacterium]MCK5369318.1 RidA family protein [Cyclobacteriaceae bacterium]